MSWNALNNSFISERKQFEDSWITMHLVPYQSNMNCCIYKQHMPKQCMLNKIGPVLKMQLQLNNEQLT